MIVTALTLGACERAPKPQPAAKASPAVLDSGTQTVRPDPDPVLANIDLPPDTIDRTLTGLREFSSRLSRQVFAENTDLSTNIASSPVSVAVALGLLSAAADPDTRGRLGRGLGITGAEVHEAMHWLT